MRLIESILNPVSVPIFVFSIIKTLQTEDKNKLTEIYKKLSVKISCGSFVEAFSRSQGIDLWVDMIDYK